MQKINAWLLQNSFGITLYIAISAIVFQLLTFNDYRNETLRWIFIMFDFSYANFNFFEAEVFNWKFYIDGSSSYTMRGYLDLVFYVLFLLAAIVYKWSNYKASKMLKFCFSLMFLFSITTMLFQLHLLFFDFIRLEYLSILFFIKACVVCYICYLYLKTWASKRIYIDKETMNLSNFKAFTLKRAKKYQRFAHYALDLFLILSIFSKYVINNYYFKPWVDTLEDAVGEQFAASIVFFICSSIYYLLFEGLFQSTPAKYLSQSSVVHLKNEKVSFANVFGRTLCRRIPFDAFSFFGKIGWHDSLAYTTVATHKREPTKYNVVYIIFVILLIALFLYRLLDELWLFGF